MPVTLADTKTCGTLYFYPFSPQLQLAEVILGPYCSLLLNDVRALVSSRQLVATTFASRLAFGHYAVVPKESTVP